MSSVTLNIYEGADENMTGNIVGSIKKKVTGLQELVTDADTFILNFPDSASPEEKLMLIGSVLMLDYRYYEENGCDDDNNRGLRSRRVYY